jgi:hypothetical protein
MGPDIDDKPSPKSERIERTSFLVRIRLTVGCKRREMATARDRDCFKRNDKADCGLVHLETVRFLYKRSWGTHGTILFKAERTKGIVDLPESVLRTP